MSHVNFVMSPSPFCSASLRTGFTPITPGTLHIYLALQKMTTSGTQLSLCYAEDQAVSFSSER